MGSWKYKLSDGQTWSTENDKISHACGTNNNEEVCEMEELPVFYPNPPIPALRRSQRATRGIRARTFHGVQLLIIIFDT